MYPNPAANDAPAWAGLRFGFRVDKAAANLPQTATGSLFSVTGGRAAVFLLGEVTTVLGAPATNAKIIHTPTVGTAMDLCAVLAIASKEVGTLFSITGVPADAMLGGGQAVRLANAVVCGPGNIGLNTSANDTGQTKWTAFWVPIDEGAVVTAA